MSALINEDAEVLSSGYTRGELKEALELIVDAENWKMPVDAVIPQHMLYRCEEACVFFTGSVLHTTAWDEESGTVRVVADGYYEAVGV